MRNRKYKIEKIITTTFKLIEINRKGESMGWQDKKRCDGLVSKSRENEIIRHWESEYNVVRNN